MKTAYIQQKNQPEVLADLNPVFLKNVIYSSFLQVTVPHLLSILDNMLQYFLYLNVYLVV